MGRTLDLSPDYPTSNWDLNHPSSAWELCPSQKSPLSIHFFSDSHSVWKYNIQHWLWRLSFVKVHFWEAPMIGFLDREKTLSEPSVPMSTSLTGHKASSVLVKVTWPLILDFFCMYQQPVPCSLQWSAWAGSSRIKFGTCVNLGWLFGMYVNPSWLFGTCVNSNSVTHFNHTPTVDFQLEK